MRLLRPSGPAAEVPALLRLRNWLLGFEARLHLHLRARADRIRPTAPHLHLGVRGEDAGYFYLRSLGYTIVARRWHSDRLRGDLDLVAWDGATIVFIEVKTRSERDLYPAFSKVRDAKQRRLRRLAREYMYQYAEGLRYRPRRRFDVLEVYLLDVRPGRSIARTDFVLHRAAFPAIKPSWPF